MNNTVFYIENNISDENFIRINDELKKSDIVINKNVFKRERILKNKQHIFICGM